MFWFCRRRWPVNLADRLPRTAHAGLFLGRFLAVSNRRSLFKGYFFYWMMSHLRNAIEALAAYSVVHKPAVLILVKIISDNAPSIKFMHPFARHGETIWMPPHQEKPFMEMIVTDKYKTAFAQAKIEIHAQLGRR